MPRVDQADPGTSTLATATRMVPVSHMVSSLHPPDCRAVVCWGFGWERCCHHGLHSAECRLGPPMGVASKNHATFAWGSGGDGLLGFSN